MTLLNNSSETIIVNPNPNNGQFLLKNIDAYDLIEIYDLTGRLIFQTISNNIYESVDLTGKSKGVYFYRVIAEKKQLRQGKIVIQ